MDFDAILLPLRRAASVAAGLWHDRTIDRDLDAAVAAFPERTAIVALQVDGGDERRITYRELGQLVDHLALGLHRLGVRAGDVVAVQLPNWWQFTVAHLAAQRIGAVTNPLMHIFRERELSFMLRHGEAKVAIVPRVFRGHDFAAMYEGMRAELPDLAHVVVVGGDGLTAFDTVVAAGAGAEGTREGAAALRDHRPGPDDVTQLIYTSGTTGEPKGVMHSANTLFSNLVAFAERLGLSSDDTVLMASPMAHQTGFLYGLLLPVALGCTAVLQDVWQPERAAELIRRERVTFTMASTPFLTDLTRHVAEAGHGVPTLRTFVCAGAPIPGPLVEQARATLGTKIVSAWGMSENGAVTTILPGDDDERAINTDGVPLPGTEIKVVGEDGATRPAGEAGRLLVRTSSNFGGYLRRPHLNGTDADGWFDTGDLARIDERGYVRITGRAKDVIIRGGENVPVVEIEALLYAHPAVAQVAIVAYPDERLGERACAVVATKPGATLTFDEMVAFLASHRVAKQYLPERLELVDTMPTTPSGKIQKFRLRERLG
jgi:cyclohexanecarboxylate-CoA ligase